MYRVLTAVLALTLVAGGCSSEASSRTAASPSAADPTAPIEGEPERLPQLRFIHPENLAFAAPFALIDPDGALGEVADAVTTDSWSTPDVLRSYLVNGDVEVAAVPTYVGANLANRGVDVRMAAVLVWGLIWVIGPDGTPADWDELRGQTVMVPFQNDMPDLVFRYLANANGLIPGQDFTIEYYAQPPEVVARLVQGAGTWAVLPEHVATVGLSRADEQERGLGRVFDLQQEWSKATGLDALIPQAGVVMPGSLVEDRPDVLAAVLDELERTVALVNDRSPDVLDRLATTSGLPAPLIDGLIPRLNLEVMAAADAREVLERFFSELYTLSPDIIGGTLPADSFYLEDPR